MTRRVVVQIDRLVLRGFRGVDRYAVAGGLERELARRLADGDVASRVQSGAEVSRLRVSPLTIPSDAGPRHVGERVGWGIGAEIIK